MKNRIFILISIAIMCLLLQAEEHTAFSAVGSVDSYCPLIEITSPVGGENYTTGDVINLEFSINESHFAAAPQTPILIELYVDNFHYAQLDTELPAEESGEYTFSGIVPDVSAEQVWFNISALDIYGNGGYASSEPFSLNLNIFYGDVNDDEEVCSYDASLILQYVVDFDPIPEDPRPWEQWRFLRADVDLDGEILACDAAYILQYIVGTLEELPVDGGRD